MAENEDQLAGTEGELADLMQAGQALGVGGMAPSPQAPVISPPWLREERLPETPAKGKKGRKLVITLATPHTGALTGEYVASLFDSLRRGKYDFRKLFIESSVIHQNRNAIATNFDPGSDFILMIDSDMSWSLEDVDRLVEADKDVIAALSYGRGYPFRPTIFNDDFSLPEIPHPLRPFEVPMIGAAFMLIKASVFKMFALARPWIGLPFDPLPLPFDPLTPGLRSAFGYEDLSFCLRARRLGFSVWCHPGCDIGHVGKTVHSTQAYLQQGFIGLRAQPLGDLTGRPPAVNFNPKRGRR
jgi:hypothetical protein